MTSWNDIEKHFEEVLELLLQKCSCKGPIKWRMAFAWFAQAPVAGDNGDLEKRAFLKKKA